MQAIISIPSCAQFASPSYQLGAIDTTRYFYMQSLDLEALPSNVDELGHNKM